MSTAAAADAAPKGKKKLLILIIAAVVLLAVVGGALAMMKKKAADADEDSGDDAAPAHVAARHDPKAAPTFVPLDTFTVNLADRETERYAQVGITLEVADPHVSEEIKAYMPAIRNNVLLVLADKTAAQLMDREGKVKLAEQVRRETARAMGYEVADPDAKAADDSAADDADGDGDAPKKKPRRRKKKSAEQELPITAVHFSNFIIQ